MFALVLALAINDSTIKANDSIATAKRVSFHRESTIKAPSELAFVSIKTRSEDEPEMLGTCHQSAYGSCWSEN